MISFAPAGGARKIGGLAAGFVLRLYGCPALCEAKDGNLRRMSHECAKFSASSNSRGGTAKVAPENKKAGSVAGACHTNRDYKKIFYASAENLSSPFLCKQKSSTEKKCHTPENTSLFARKIFCG
jgi:hypothetical protein